MRGILWSHLYKSKQYDLKDMFKDTFRYLDDILFTIDNTEFDKYISDILVNQQNVRWTKQILQTKKLLFII